MSEFHIEARVGRPTSNARRSSIADLKSVSYGRDPAVKKPAPLAEVEKKRPVGELEDALHLQCAPGMHAHRASGVGKDAVRYRAHGQGAWRSFNPRWNGNSSSTSPPSSEDRLIVVCQRSGRLPSKQQIAEGAASLGPATPRQRKGQARVRVLVRGASIQSTSDTVPACRS